MKTGAEGGNGMTQDKAREWVASHPNRKAALEAFLDSYVRARAEVFVEARGQGREPKIIGLDVLAVELRKGRKA
jgi:hypothetical protein